MDDVQTNELIELFLKFKDHRETLVRKAVMTNCWKFASYNPNGFVTSYLNIIMGYLNNVIAKREKDRGFGNCMLEVLVKVV